VITLSLLAEGRKSCLSADKLF